MHVSASEYRRQFLTSEEALYAKSQLDAMMADPLYNTRASYVAGQAEDMSFADTHLGYLSNHPQIKVREYLSNLRLKTKLRS